MERVYFVWDLIICSTYRRVAQTLKGNSVWPRLSLKPLYARPRGDEWKMVDRRRFFALQPHTELVNNVGSLCKLRTEKCNSGSWPTGLKRCCLSRPAKVNASSVSSKQSCRVADARCISGPAGVTCKERCKAHDRATTQFSHLGRSLQAEGLWWTVCQTCKSTTCILLCLGIKASARETITSSR